MNTSQINFGPGALGIKGRDYLGFAPGPFPLATASFGSGSTSCLHTLRFRDARVPLKNFRLEPASCARPARTLSYEMSFECPMDLNLGQGYRYYVDDIFAGELFIVRTGLVYRGVVKCED